MANNEAAKDYFGMDLSNRIENPDGFDFDTDSQNFPSQANNKCPNSKVLSPLVIFNLAPRHAIGFTTRIRGFVNINRIHGQLYKTLSDDDATDSNFNIDMEHLNNTVQYLHGPG